MVVSLLAVAIIAAQTFERSFSAKELRQANISGLADLNRVAASGHSITGFADLNRVEAQLRAITGFADLNRVEAKPKTITGFADLNRVDSSRQVATNSTGSNQIASQSVRITGFADLNRVASQAILPQTGGSPAQAPSRVCPHLSTPAGERDAGASAPAYVLQAMVCTVAGGE
jgi:hypothetical protein